MDSGIFSQEVSFVDSGPDHFEGAAPYKAYDYSAGRPSNHYADHSTASLEHGRQWYSMGPPGYAANDPRAHSLRY